MIKLTYGSRYFVLDWEPDRLMHVIGGIDHGMFRFEHTTGVAAIYLPAPVELILDFDFQVPGSIVHGF